MRRTAVASALTWVLLSPPPSGATEAEDRAASLATIEAYTLAIEAGIAAPGQHAALYQSRCQLRNAVGEPATALADCNRAIELDPTLAVAYASRAEALVTLGDRDGALADYAEAVRHDPTLAAAHENSGRLLLDRGAAADAIGPLTRTIDLAPARSGPVWPPG